MLLEHPEARVSVEPLGGDRQRVVVDAPPGTFIAKCECETGYPAALIERILQVKGPAYLCDEIVREEDPQYVALFLRCGLLGFVPPEEFVGARLLDFGSGSGASTVILSRMFPETDI